jgi:preprotein translocase subunit SecG
VQALLLTIELLVAAGLIVVVLLQRSEGGALGMGGGGGSGFGGLFSPRGAADTLTRATTILAALFILTCLGLNLVELRGHDEHAFLEGTPKPAPAAPAKPFVPAGPTVPTPH